jgi:hypothetical protein
MIKFLKELLYDNYVYCPWGKYIPRYILKKFKLLRVGVFLLNLNNHFEVTEDNKYWRLNFITGSDANFWLDKKLYKVETCVKF